MTNKNLKTKKGFTIIEVVLVLAIAGLIFLMVFIALPALQRSQRDTQRRDDYGMLSSAITNYSSSNGGRIYKLAGATQASQNKCTQISAANAARYLNSSGPNGEAQDPDGVNYDLWVCTWAGWNARTAAPKSGTLNRGQVVVVVGADCTGTATINGVGADAPKSNSSTRAFAIYGFLESGSGSYCSNSQ